MKTTKQDLQKRVGVLEGELSEYKERESHLRRQFSRALGRYKWNPYSTIGSPEPQALSWEEVWVELGKLLANQKKLEYVEAVEHLHSEVARLSAIVEADKQEPLRDG